MEKSGVGELDLDGVWVVISSLWACTLHVRMNIEQNLTAPRASILVVNMHLRYQQVLLVSLHGFVHLYCEHARFRKTVYYYLLLILGHNWLKTKSRKFLNKMSKAMSR